MDYPIRITTFCKCGRLTVTIATEYKVYNQDNTLHTCRDIMVDSKTDLTFKDCSEYIRCGFGDESISRCNLTGHCCEADEAGEQCSMWEEEKAEMLEEEHLYRVSKDVKEGRQFVYYHFKTDREELNAMLWSIADPDEPGVADDIAEILTIFDSLKEERVAGEKLDSEDLVYKRNDGLYYKAIPLDILKEGLTLKDIDIAIDKIKQDGTDMFYGDTYVLL